jgi:hypothetical protein
MKRFLLPALLCLLPLLFAACGYQNPHLAAKREMAALEGAIEAPVVLQAQMWSNRTSELGLQLVFYNSLANWFQKSGRLRLARAQEEADYSIPGEIIAIDEGLTRGTVRLTVGYSLVDLHQGETVWQVPSQTFSESYFIDNSAARTQDNKRRALEKIADDLAESIYMRTLHHLRNRTD